MLVILGNAAILIAFIGFLASALYPHAYLRRGASIFLSLSLALFVYAFVVNDFSIQAVFANSSTIIPVKYKIAASWSSHEGSMLFFAWLLSCSSLYSYNLMLDSRGARLADFFIASFLLILWLTSSPFKTIGFFASEGIGLNPLLQDIGLMYHPPVLYLGHSFYLPIFSHLIADKKVSKQQILQLSRLGIFFLTSGIGLGSWWAYRELGWGGFWFFDPVENIALLPWFSAIAFHHSMLTMQKGLKVSKWAMFWGLATFILIISGMFLIRSNLLISLHSFAIDSTKALAIGLLACGSTLLAVYKYALFAAENLQEIQTDDAKIVGVNFANKIWLAAAASVLFAILLPIGSAKLYNLEIAIEAKYFQLLLLPLLLVINLVIALYLYAYKYSINIRNIALMIFILSIFASFWIFSVKEVITIAAITSSSLLIIASLVQYASIKNHQSLLGHLAYALITLSIALNALFSVELDLVGNKGANADMAGFNVKIVDLRHSHGPNYLRQIVDVLVTDKRSSQAIMLQPENRWYVIENKLTAESSIYSAIGYDLYAVLNRVDGQNIHLKIYCQRFISFIWLGCLLLAFSFIRINSN